MDTSSVLQIPQGSIAKIIQYLKEEDYSVNKLDSWLLRFIGSPQSGWVEIGTTRTTKADFLYKLVTAKAALQSITLIPGETTYIFFNQLSQKLGLNRVLLEHEFEKLSKRREGVFVPNTYKIPKGITEEKLISLLLEQSKKQMQAYSMKLFGSYNEEKWFRFVAIASVIQKESANNDEMPLVSSVIYNRIKKGMPLQMDGTLNYGPYSHVKVTPKRIKTDDTLYNTYKYKGIPAIPVCNVGFEAIRAAIFPAKSDYLYFMKSKSGTHDFSCNYSTHLSNIRSATK
jgi:UPF0755 protein